MTTQQTIQVINSFDLSTIGIIVHLQHTLHGLSTGATLRSLATNKEWLVIKRVLFNHANDIQTIFSNETPIFFNLSFNNIESRQQSRNDIQGRERQNIFEYQLQAIGEHIKPEPNDILLYLPQNFPQ